MFFIEQLLINKDNQKLFRTVGVYNRTDSPNVKVDGERNTKFWIDRFVYT